MITRLAILGFSVFLLQACTNAPHNPHAVPVRVMGSNPQTQAQTSPVPQHSQPVRQAAIFNPARVSTSDPVNRHSVTHVGQKQTVSVSPYEGQRMASNRQQTQVVRQQPPVVTRPTQTYTLPSNTTITTASSTTHAARQAPVVPSTTTMSISDVIDTTIRNAPDLPIAKTTGTASVASSSGTGQSVASVPPSTTKGTGHQPSKQELASLGRDKPRFYWPVRGNVISTYGSKGSGKQNDGINISAPRGTPVKAAAAGMVVYSGEDLGGLGHLILIRHSGNYHTAYAHVDNKLVKTGDRVAVGQAIANVGKTGNVTTPQLHFEIRDGKKPVNPDGFLPRS